MKFGGVLQKVWLHKIFDNFSRAVILVIIDSEFEHSPEVDLVRIRPVPTTGPKRLVHRDSGHTLLEPQIRELRRLVQRRS